MGFDEIDGAIYAAMGMIDTSKQVDGVQWAIVLRLVAVIRRHQLDDASDRAELSYETIAAQAHCSVNTVRKLLGGKTRQGRLWRTWWIIERVGEKGIGTRATAWAVYHPSHWRKVPWLETNKELRRGRLGFPTHDQTEPTEGDEKVNALRGKDMQSDLAARSPTGQRAARNPKNGLAARSPTGHRAASKSSAARFKGGIARLEPFDDAPATTHPVGDESPTTTEQEQQQWLEAQELIKAIERRARNRMASNALKARCDRLLWMMPLEEVLAGLAHAPAELKIPMLVKWCEDVADHKIDHLLDADDAPAARDPLQKALAQVQAEIASYEGTDVDVPERLRRRLEECQNQLQAREEPKK